MYSLCKFSCNSRTQAQHTHTRIAPRRAWPYTRTHRAIKPSRAAHETDVWIATYTDDESRKQAQAAVVERLKETGETGKLHQNVGNANECDMVLAGGKKHTIVFEDSRFEDIDFRKWSHENECKNIVRGVLRLKAEQAEMGAISGQDSFKLTARVVRERARKHVHEQLPVHTCTRRQMHEHMGTCT